MGVSENKVHPMYGHFNRKYMMTNHQNLGYRIFRQTRIWNNGKSPPHFPIFRTSLHIRDQRGVLRWPWGWKCRHFRWGRWAQTAAEPRVWLKHRFFTCVWLFLFVYPRVTPKMIERLHHYHDFTVGFSFILSVLWVTRDCNASNHCYRWSNPI